jgi:hypothetical protein
MSAVQDSNDRVTIDQQQKPSFSDTTTNSSSIGGGFLNIKTGNKN